MRLLAVEDDPVSAKLIDIALRSEGMIVEHIACGEDAVDLARHYDFDAIVLDDQIPDIEALELIRQIRAAKIPTPVLVLSGKKDEDYKNRALATGADDFLLKPFHKSALVERISAIVRRSNDNCVSTIEIGKLVIDLAKKSVEISGRPLHVTSKEYQILELLALRKGATITKEMFLDHLYGGVDKPELKLIDVFIAKIRKKIKVATDGDNYIETVWGRGYTLAVNDNEELSYGTEDDFSKHLIPRADKLINQAMESIRALNNTLGDDGCLISDDLRDKLEKVSDCIDLIHIKRQRQVEFHQFLADINSSISTLEQLVPHLHLDLSVSCELARESLSASVEVASADKVEAVAVGAGIPAPPAVSTASGWIEGEAFQTDAYKMLADYAKCKAKSRTRLETFLCTMVMLVECLRKVIPLVPSQKSNSKTK